MKRIVNLFMLATILAAPIALAACNTTEGAGRDIERSGEWIQDKAGKDDVR